MRLSYKKIRVLTRRLFCAILCCCHQQGGKYGEEARIGVQDLFRNDRRGIGRGRRPAVFQLSSGRAQSAPGAPRPFPRERLFFILIIFY